jgi:hypothetical protein
VTIALPNFKVPLDTRASIHLHFDRYFVPRELGINEDTRRLVLCMPEETILSR